MGQGEDDITEIMRHTPSTRLREKAAGIGHAGFLGAAVASVELTPQFRWNFLVVSHLGSYSRRAHGGRVPGFLTRVTNPPNTPPGGTTRNGTPVRVRRRVRCMSRH
jgi:hypothetical protein